MKMFHVIINSFYFNLQQINKQIQLKQLNRKSERNLNDRRVVDDVKT